MLLARRWPMFIVFVSLLGIPGPSGTLSGEESVKKPAKSDVEPGAVEVRFTDNSNLKLTLKDERIELTTPYGKLLVPVADIRRIEFASRIPEDVLKRIESAVANLGSPEFPLREAAAAELLAQRERAYPALLQATRSNDPEVVRRAEKLVDEVRELVPEEMLEFRKADVVHTEDSKISGRIENKTLKAHTSQFGEVRVKLTDVRALRSLAFDPEPDKLVAALANHGTLTGYQNQFGKEVRFQVTGALDGSLWGTDVYTLDSSLAKAAVHAGVLKAGQSGVVKVKIIATPAAFLGSTRNGISSAGYGPYPTGAYQVSK